MLSNSSCATVFQFRGFQLISGSVAWLWSPSPNHIHSSLFTGTGVVTIGVFDNMTLGD